MGLAAREIGINWNTIKYYLIAEKPDKEGRTYERVEEADEEE